MSTKWSTETVGKSGGKPDFSALLKNESRVILLRGKNIFGDFIYCYLKIPIPDIQKLEAALNGDADYNLHDFGEVLAAGRGEPPADVRAEIAATYPAIGSDDSSASDNSDSATASAPIPAEKKNWDEY